MKKLLLVIASAMILASCAGGANYGPGGPNVMIVGEDSDSDTVPRNSRVFRRVLDALSNELQNAGFSVFDETAVTLDFGAPGRSRRADAELIDIARSASRPPIDVIVIFQIFADSRAVGHTTRVQARVTGRILSVHSGQRLGNFEVRSPREWRAPADCDRECSLETVGRYARILAAEVGSVLAEKLAYETGRDGDDDGTEATLTAKYTLVFDGFTPREMFEIGEFLVVFRGYESHRPIYSGHRHQEIWYEADITSARLLRNLNKMLKVMEISGRVAFSGNEYSVTKIRSRRRGKPVKGSNW